MRMKWEESSPIFDSIVSEELPCDTSVFTGDIISLFQDAQCTECDIFEITDGGGDDGEQEDKR